MEAVTLLFYIVTQSTFCIQSKEYPQDLNNMSSLNADCTFSQGVGDLVVLALEHCEQFRRMPEFCQLAERLFTVCENLMEVSSPSSHAQSKYHKFTDA